MRDETRDLRGDDIIDSRDVIARIEYLQGLQEEAQSKASEVKEEIESLEAEEDLSEEDDTHLAELRESLWTYGDSQEYGETADWTEEEAAELKELLSLQDEAEDCGDWKDGATLIKDSYFTEYAEQLADDLGYLNENPNRWPFNHIDWEAAAEELQQDYSQVSFFGDDYWVRG